MIVVVEFLRAWWLLPLAIALCSFLLIVLNLAVLRDPYIVESFAAMHARHVVAASHVLIAFGAGSLVLPLFDFRAELFIGGLALGVVLNSIGSIVIIGERIFKRWNVAPWDGDDDRRSGFDRRVNPVPWLFGTPRKGERRAEVTRPAPLDP